MGLIDDVVGSVKQVREVAQRLHDAELQGLVADLMLKAADLKMELANDREENLELRRQLEQCRKRADLRSKMEKRDNFYYLREPVEGYGEGPFCPTCFDRDGCLVSMMTKGRSVSLTTGKVTTGTRWFCGHCDNKRKE